MIKYSITILILVLSNINTIGQSLIESGDKFFAENKHLEAIVDYKKALVKSTENVDYLNKQIATSYYHLNLYDSASVWLNKVNKNQLDKTPELVKIYGKVLVNTKKYEDAIQLFSKYNELKGYTNDDEHLINSVNWIIKNEKTPPTADLTLTNIDVGPICLGISLYNNMLITSAPEKSKEEKTVYYDFVSYNKTSPSQFKEPSKLNGKINSKYYQGTPFFESENVLYFSSNAEDINSFNEKKIEKYELSESGINNLKIYKSVYEKNSWGEITELPFNSKNYSCSSPFLTEDKLTLYFASTMPGGTGGYDLYKVTRENLTGTWSTPLNLGKEVNTKGNDVYPFIIGNQFFYSSNGRLENFGGLDVYEAIIDSNGVISAIKNSGMPINSSKDDFAYILNKDAKTGYLASNRELDKDQIYYFVNRPKLENIHSIFSNKLTQAPISNIEGFINDSIFINSNENGEWEANVSTDNDVLLKIDNPWYETLDTNLGSLDKFMQENKKIYLSPIMLYGKITNANLYEEPVKVKLFMKDENGAWVFEDEMEVADDGEWSFHIRKDKEYKTEFYVGDELSDKEIIGRADENDKLRTETLENLLDYELTFENTDIDGYAVQIGAYRFPENFNYSKFLKLTSFIKDNQGIEDGIQRFLSKTMVNLNDAKKLRLEVIKLGITDAFVVAIKNKKRVAIIDLSNEEISNLMIKDILNNPIKL